MKLNQLKLLASSLFIAVSLSGCGITKIIDISTKPAEFQIFHPDDPRAVKLEDITIRVVNDDIVAEVLKEIAAEQGTEDYAFIVLSFQDYERLSLNIAELRRYIKQQREIINYYRNIDKNKGQPPNDTSKSEEKK